MNELIMIIIFLLTVLLFIRQCYKSIKQKSDCGHCSNCSSNQCYSSKSTQKEAHHENRK